MLRGGTGNDVLEGGRGDDAVEGTDGQDILRARLVRIGSPVAGVGAATALSMAVPRATSSKARLAATP